MDYSGERIRFASCVENDHRHRDFAQMQLMNDPVAWLAGEIPKQRFARSLTLTRYLVLRAAERPHLPSRRRIRGLKRTPAEDQTEAGLADPGVSDQYHFGINVMDGACRH